MVEERKNIDEWQPTQEEAYVYGDVKMVKLNLKKFLGPTMMKQYDDEALDRMGTFFVDKKLFTNSLSIITNYIDYFINFYDLKKELLMIYLRLKTKIDNNKGSIEIETFRKNVIEAFFLRSNLKEAVEKLVDDNYCLDVTVDSKSGRVFTSLTDFTNEDAKLFLKTSLFMKLIIPPVSHYMKVNKEYSKEEKNDLNMNLFVDLFYRVGTEEEVTSLLYKLYDFASKKIANHENKNPTLWEQQATLRGVTSDKFIDRMMAKLIMHDNVFKFNFTDNIIAFIKTIIERQLKHAFNDEKYKKNIIRVDGNKGPDGLSGIDKLEQSMTKVDETQIVLSEINIKYVMQELRSSVTAYTIEEVNYYIDNCDPENTFQTMMVFYHFVKYFKSFRELEDLNVQQYAELLIIMKKQLLDRGYQELPDLVTSNMGGKINNRLIQNEKFMQKLKTSETYINIMENTYSALKNFKEQAILEIISKVINNKFTFVDYDNPELLGEEIEFNQDIITDEILVFIDNI